MPERRPLGKDQIIVHRAIRGLRRLLSGRQRVVTPEVLPPVSPQQVTQRRVEGLEFRADVRASFRPETGVRAHVSVELGAPKPEPLDPDEAALMARLNTVFVMPAEARQEAVTDLERRITRLERPEIERRLEEAGITKDDDRYNVHVFHAGQHPDLTGEKLKQFLESLNPGSGSQGI